MAIVPPAIVRDWFALYKLRPTKLSSSAKPILSLLGKGPRSHSGAFKPVGAAVMARPWFDWNPWASACAEFCTING